MGRWLRISLVALAWLGGPIAAAEPPPAAPARPPFKGAIPTAVVKAGEATTLTVCWDDGAGRLPVEFVGVKPLVGQGLERDYDGRPRCEQEGVTFALDDDEKGATRAAWEAIGEKSDLAGQQADGTFKHLSIRTFQIAVAADARPGARRFWYLQVSGTGRSMFLQSEIRVIVTK